MTTPTPAVMWDHHHVVPGWEAQGKGDVTDCSLEEEGESDGWGGVSEESGILLPCGEAEAQREEGICPW